MKRKIIIGASLGNCVHVAGVQHFLSQAEDCGWEVVFLGPAVSVDKIIAAVEKYRPDVVAIGYRLTPDNVVPLVLSLKERAGSLSHRPQWLFGGTRPVANAVSALGFFDTVYDGAEDLDDCIAYLKNTSRNVEQSPNESTIVSRIAQKSPYPLLRHHFGLPSFEDTLSGIRAIAQSRVLDVISLGIDQNTQQFFFHPEKRDSLMDGAGGVPVHNEAQFRMLKEASQTGNFPLMRCYSGTADVMRFADVLLNTIDNAWCATPLCWFNRLDGRGERTVSETMRQAQSLLKLHAKRSVPVEINEPHHWSLRDAHDTIAVAMAYISAYNARACGLRDYVAQFMFNTPGALSFSMDLAKALAGIELAQSLETPDFHIYRETRAGLPFLKNDLDLAKGQLAASTMLQMAVRPQIIHVVGYSEAEHAATSTVVIESAKIVRGVIRSVLDQSADPVCDPAVQNRKGELISEARMLIDFIIDQYRDVSADPLADPNVIADCVRRGILAAPHILQSDLYRGVLKTRIIGGKCVAFDDGTGLQISESQRLETIALSTRKELIS